MASLGTLVASLSLDYAEFSKGLDRSGQQAQNFAQKLERNLNSAVGNVKSSFVGFTAAVAGATAAALSAQAAFTRIADAINKLDSFDELSGRIGVTTERLSQLAFAAKLNGVELDGLTTGLKKLSINSVEAANGNKELKTIFDSFGISLKNADGSMKAADVLLLEVAESMKDVTDSTQLTALAVKLFGKAGADMVPLLKQGADGINKLTQEADALGATIGGDAAAQAALFNDNLDRLSVALEATAKSAANSLLPSLNSIAEKMLDASVASGGLASGLLTLFNDTLTPGTLAERLREINKEIESLNLSLGVANSRNSKLFLKEAALDQATKTREFLKAQQLREALASGEGAGDDAISRRAAAEKRKAEIAANEAAARALKDSTAAQKAENEAKKEAERILKLQTDQKQRLTEAINQHRASQEKDTEEQLKDLSGTQEQITKLREKLETIGMNRDELRAYTKAQEEATIATLEFKLRLAESSGASQESILVLRAQIDALKELSSLNGDLNRAEAAQELKARLKTESDAAIEETRRANIELIDGLINTFGTIATQGGKEAGKSIVKAIKIELQKAVFKVAIQAALGVDAQGNSTGGGVVSSLLGDSGKSLLQEAVKGGFTAALSSSAAYAAAVPGLTSAAAGSQAAMLAAQTGSFGAAGTAATAAAGGSAAAGFASSALAAAPYVAVAVLAYQLFKKKKISATSLGGSDVLFSGSGQELSRSSGPGEQDTEFVRSIITPLKDQYVGLTKALGGVQQAFTLTASGNTGRQGQNPNFAIKFGINNQTFSSSEGVALNEANVGTESLRALLGLLAQTDLPDNIDSVVRGLNLTNASLQEMEATLGLVQAIDFVNDNFGLLGDNLGVLANASSDAITQFFQAVGGLDSLSASLSNFNEKFLTEGEKQSLLLGQVSKAFEALNIPLPKTRDEFKQLVQQQNLLTESGAQAYSALLNLTDAVDQLYPVVEAAAESRREEIREIRAVQEAKRIQQEAEQARVDEIIKTTQEAYDAAIAVGDFSSALQEFRKITALELRAMANDFKAFNNALEQASLGRAISLETQRISTLISRPEIDSLSGAILNSPFLADQAKAIGASIFEGLSEVTQTALSSTLGNLEREVIGNFKLSALPKTPVQEFLFRKQQEAAGGFAGIQIADAIKNLDQASVEFQEGLELFGSVVLGTAEITVEQFNDTLKYLTLENLGKALRYSIDNGILEPGLAQIKLYLDDLSVAASKFADVAGTVSNQMGKLDLAATQMNNIVSVFNEGVDAVLRGAVARAAIFNSEYEQRFGLVNIFNAKSVLSEKEIQDTERSAVIARAAEIASSALAETSFDSVQQVIEKTLSKFDQEGYAATIIQISDALAQGKLTAEEYATAFQQASRQFTGVAQQIEQAEQALEQAQQAEQRALEQAQQAEERAKSERAEAIQSQISQLESASEATLGFAGSIRDLRNDLLLAMTGPSNSTAVNGALFTDALAAVRGGDTSRIGELSTAANAFVEAARGSSSDYVEFIKRTAFVQSELQSLEAGFMSQYEIDLASLESSKAAISSLNQQTDVLTQINESTLSVAEAVANLEALQRRFLVDTTSVFAGIPGFSTGGMFGGGLRIVGENGPELEATGPSRIISNSRLQSMMQGGSSNDAMVQELRALRQEVAQLRESNSAENRALVGNTAKATQILVKGTDNGTKDFAGNEI